jgi:hypothetical protein
MQRIIIEIMALTISLIIASSAFAQGDQKKYKKTCEQVCAERCPTAAHRNLCWIQCPNKCEMGRRDGNFRN